MGPPTKTELYYITTGSNGSPLIVAAIPHVRVSSALQEPGAEPADLHPLDGINTETDGKRYRQAEFNFHLIGDFYRMQLRDQVGFRVEEARIYRNDRVKN